MVSRAISVVTSDAFASSRWHPNDRLAFPRFVSVVANELPASIALRATVNRRGNTWGGIRRADAHAEEERRAVAKCLTRWDARGDAGARNVLLAQRPSQRARSPRVSQSLIGATAVSRRSKRAEFTFGCRAARNYYSAFAHLICTGTIAARHARASRYVLTNRSTSQSEPFAPLRGR